MTDIITEEEISEVSEEALESEVVPNLVTAAEAEVVLDQEQFLKLKLILEAILMASDRPLDIKSFINIFEEHNNNPNTRSKDKVKYNNDYIKNALVELGHDLQGRAIELKFLGAGYRIQTKADYASWVQGIWQEKPSKYSKATLETLAIMAYRQPITRSEIEHIRGVAVSSQIIRNLLDREWIKVVGHRDLPGRPAIYATTQQFLYDLNLTKLEDLPTLADIKEIKQNLFSEADVALVAASAAREDLTELEAEKEEEYIH